MDLIDEKFQLLKNGSNSRIYRYGLDSSAIILKTVAVSCAKQSKHMSNEYKLLRKLHHPNIINVLKHKQNVKLKFQVSQQVQQEVHNVLVMEWANLGNLLDFYKRNKLTISEIKNIFRAVTLGLEYLHDNFIAHRDLKLQNILVFQSQEKDGFSIKIADFGFAENVYDLNTQSIKLFNNFKGTKRGYMSPEIHQSLLNSNNSYDALKCDIFALGVILFSLVLGKLPFEYGNRQNKLYRLISQKKHQQFWAYHSKQLQKLELKEYSMVDQFKQLFQNMVAYNCQQRWTIKNVIQSQWLKSGFNINE